MKKLLVLLYVFLMLNNVCFAQAQEFVGRAEYTMGSNETLDAVKERLLLSAKRNAVEQAGTYLESITEVKNGLITRDDILVIATGVAKLVPNTLEYNYNLLDPSKGTMQITATAKFLIDNDELQKVVSNRNKKAVETGKEQEFYQSAKILYDDIKYILDKKKAKTNKQEAEVIKQKQRECEVLLRQAVQVKLDFCEAYIMLAELQTDKFKWEFLAEADKEVHKEKAINWYKEALKYQEKSDIYYEIGKLYDNRYVGLAIMAKELNAIMEKGVNKEPLPLDLIDSEKMAIEYYTKAIKLNPNNIKAHQNRAQCYSRLKQYEEQFKDECWLIDNLKNQSELARTFGTRARLYERKDDLASAIDDYDSAMAIPYNRAEWLIHWLGYYGGSFSIWVSNKWGIYRKILADDKFRMLREKEANKARKNLEASLDALTEHKEGLDKAYVDHACNAIFYAALNLDKNEGIDYLKVAENDLQYVANNVPDSKYCKAHVVDELLWAIKRFAKERDGL